MSERTDDAGRLYEALLQVRNSIDSQSSTLVAQHAERQQLLERQNERTEELFARLLKRAEQLLA